MRQLAAENATQSEQAKYADVWAHQSYRVKCHGLALWQSRRDVFPPVVESAVDYGHGTGRLVAAWHEAGIDAYGVDIAANAADPSIAAELGDRLIVAPLWDFNLPGVCHVGVCADVLEHIPEDLVDDVLDAIAGTCRVAVLKIACFPDQWFGHTLHLTVREPGWWMERIAARGGCLFQHPCEPRKLLVVWETAAGE